MAPANLLTEWARLLLGSFVALGVRRAVISPGSRSTPFAWAALEQRGLQCDLAWDEREAAFFALGQARVSGDPTLLICTSGSAAANYFPAVMEASEAYLPLLVLTADRPLELQNVRAPQCVDQLRLYGNFARAFFDLGAPEASPLALAALRRTAAQAVALTRFPTPGPVHLNARARKPLEPVTAQNAEELALQAQVSALLAEPPATRFEPNCAPHTDAIARTAQICKRAERGLIICGPRQMSSHNEATLALARRTGFPLLAEATSQIRFQTSPDAAPLVAGFEWILPRFAKNPEQRPDLILQLGEPPTSTALNRFLDSAAGSSRVIVNAQGWPDPSSAAHCVVGADPEDFARELLTALESSPADSAADAKRTAWQNSWLEQERAIWPSMATSLGNAFSEAAAVRLLVAGLPTGSQLFVGNSLPIRDLDAFVPAGARGIQVAFQRGVNGIDGLVSGALGVASMSNNPSLAIVGDVSFLYGIGGLALARSAASLADRSIVLAVIDNGGGRIFDTLPIRDALSKRPEFARYWLSPPGLDLRPAAELYGVAYARVNHPSALQEALSAALERRGVTLLHVQVPAESALTARQHVAAAWARSAERLT